MAYDEGLAELLRGDLEGHPDIREKKMFGGLAFMLNGHMVCGVHKGGGMFRVGKANEAAALALPGVRQMAFTGRPMTGMVDAADEAVGDDAQRGQLIGLCLSFVLSLPPK